jgi:hypothetical protein
MMDKCVNFSWNLLSGGNRLAHTNAGALSLSNVRNGLGMKALALPNNRLTLRRCSPRLLFALDYASGTPEEGALPHYEYLCNGCGKKLSVVLTLNETRVGQSEVPKVRRYERGVAGGRILRDHFQEKLSCLK